MPVHNGKASESQADIQARHTSATTRVHFGGLVEVDSTIREKCQQLHDVYLRTFQSELDLSGKHQKDALMRMRSGIPARMPCYNCVKGEPVFKECIISSESPGLGCANCLYAGGFIGSCSLVIYNTEQLEPSMMRDDTRQELWVDEAAMATNIRMAAELPPALCLSALYDNVLRVEAQVKKIIEASYVSTLHFAMASQAKEQQMELMLAAGRLPRQGHHTNTDTMDLVALQKAILSIRNGCVNVNIQTKDILALALVSCDGIIERNR